MISDEVFAKEMDGYLKKLNVTKKERNEQIGHMLGLDIDLRNDMLDAMKKKANNKAGVIPSEKNEQIELVYQFRKKYPGAVIFSVRNDGFRTVAEKAEQVAMGLWAGVSDLICLEFNMCIEMKKAKGGIQSDKQKEFQAYMESIGWVYILAEGCEDGLQKIELARLAASAD